MQKNVKCLMMAAGILLVFCAAGGRAVAMKALSDRDLGGVAGNAGISIYAKDLDATLLQMKELELDLSPNQADDSTFLIRDDTYAKTLNINQDDDDIAMAFCGSPTDESEPIDVDVLGFDIDIAGCYDDPGLKTDAATFAMTGYGSTNFHAVWELVQFAATTTVDVFGFHIGEIFWHEQYLDPDENFMHLFLSPPQAFNDNAFFDSALGAWANRNTSDIRSSQGMAGELGLKLGGGEVNFRGFKDQYASGQDIMFAGDIIDKGTATTPYPNWKTFSENGYYSRSVSDWNIRGEFVSGVHHQRTYDRSGFADSGYAQSQIGRTGPTRPMRFAVATADSGTYDADSDGQADTYLVAYVNGHFQRSVYYPDSRESSMGTSSGAVVAPVANGVLKSYILGEVRVGETGWATADKDGDGTNESVSHVGSWVLNDLNMVYSKMVLPGERNLLQETDQKAGNSEDFLIPDVDYGDGGSSPSTFSFQGSPTSVNRTMEIAKPYDGTGGNPLNSDRTDLTRDSTFWNN